MRRRRSKLGLLHKLGKKAGRRAVGLSASEFEAAFQRETSLADRSLRSFSVVVFLPRGEEGEGLAELAGILAERLRVSDCAGSLEDGLWAVLLPETEEGGARILANDVMVQLAEIGLKFDFKVYVYPRKGGDSRRGERELPRGGSEAKPDSPPERRDLRQAIRATAPAYAGVARGQRAAEDGDTIVWRSGLSSARASAPAEALRSSSQPAEVQGGSDFAEWIGLSDLRLSLGGGRAMDLSPLCCEPLSLRRRALDVAVAGGLLLLLSPILILVALAVKLSSPGPILFVQKRAGQGGTPFDFLKFRSMYVDAEARKAALAGSNEKDGPIFKMKNDPRMTPIGRFLRRYSLDELPQLYNVLRGDMTLVGPRPPTLDEVANYEPWQLGRLRLKGGLTCIWQVSGRSEIGFQEWVRMDMRYMRQRGLKMDLGLLARTAGAVVSGKGAW